MASWGERDAAIPSSAWASMAVRLAEQLDDPGVSATAKSMCARVLADCLTRLAEVADAAAGEVSPLDEIRDRRDRKARVADAKG